jgi:RNA polymerase sigma factor (sigma-70 family)
MGRGRPLDEDGFESLFRGQFAPTVRALTLVAGDREAAADAVQDAFLQAHRHWARVSGLEDPAAWVRHAAINRLRNQRRGQGRMVAALPRLVRADVPALDPADTVDVVPALMALPKQQRAAVALYYLLDQPTSAIADTLGVSEATVRSHLRNARLRLVDSFPKELQEASPAAEGDGR